MTGWQLLAFLLTAVILLVGGVLITVDSISFGELIAFYVGASALSLHVVNITGCVNQFASSTQPLAQVYALLIYCACGR